MPAMPVKIARMANPDDADRAGPVAEGEKDNS